MQYIYFTQESGDPYDSDTDTTYKLPDDFERLKESFVQSSKQNNLIDLSEYSVGINGNIKQIDYSSLSRALFEYKRHQKGNPFNFLGTMERILNMLPKDLLVLSVLCADKKFGEKLDDCIFVVQYGGYKLYKGKTRFYDKNNILTCIYNKFNDITVIIPNFNP